ncbi:DNA-binding response regulator, OmpR family, contains REC and winged-helix (wHTH) domain [Oscillospiraceae bacterium]|nr:DNA-binding response regulator, OmpR family, contains REC and winged-helix (wHTH) domain [Oscillospiraceae bacterium]
MAKILIVEDDEDIGDILSRELSKEGHEIHRAYSGTEGRIMLKTDPDLILMDLMLPGMTGEELISHVTDNTPVIAVSAKSSTDDKLTLFEKGCVDYITKPFEIRELKARVKVALSNSAKKKNTPVLTAGDIEMDTESRIVSVCSCAVRFTRTEYAILKILISNKGRVVSKSQILDLIEQDTPDCIDESSLKVHISNIRKKIKSAGGTDCIEAVWGIGFKIAS